LYSISEIEYIECVSDQIILGVDPGTIVTGYGVIRSASGRFEAIDYGCIRPPSRLPLQERYQIIFAALELLISSHRPTAIATESQFVLKNVQSAIKLGMAKGMVFLAAARAAIPVAEYAPRRAKLAVVGTGGASKHQVQRMIAALLRLPKLPEPEDAADALALALCHAHVDQNQIRQQFLGGDLCTNTSKELWLKKSRSAPSLKPRELDID
jgi:crossover junction endodeoxyribonuclease RuvC